MSDEEYTRRIAAAEAWANGLLEEWVVAAYRRVRWRDPVAEPALYDLERTALRRRLAVATLVARTRLSQVVERVEAEAYGGAYG